jgi:hypothetical protein
MDRGVKYAIVGVHLLDADGFDQQGDQLGIIHVSGALATADWAIFPCQLGLSTNHSYASSQVV